MVNAVSPSSAARGRVLLVDDDRSVLVTTQAVLEDEYDVSATTDANDAITHIERTSFDIVCVDYMMPGTNGLELLARVAERPEFTARVLISGHREHQDKWQRVYGDLYYVLLKPFSPDQLLTLFARAMAQTRLRRKVAGMGGARVTTPSRPLPRVSVEESVDATAARGRRHR